MLTTHSNFSIKCPLCSSTDQELIYDTLCASNSPHAIAGRILRCTTCGMWFKACEPTVQAYGEEYAEDALAGDCMNYFTARSLFQRVLENVKYETGSSQPKLLDIGTGAGTMLEEAKIAGYSAEGIELCPSLANEATRKGFVVRCGDAADLKEDEKYDVVTAMDIIEHLHSPLELLRAAHKSLKLGGELVVYTPNHRGALVILAKLLARVGIHSASRNIFGGNHLCFFDDRTLCAALQEAGFTIRRLWKFPYDPRRPGMKVSLASLAIIKAVEELGRPFGAVFRMVAFAKKQKRPTIFNSPARYALWRLAPNRPTLDVWYARCG